MYNNVDEQIKDESGDQLRKIKTKVNDWYAYFAENISFGKEDYYFLFVDQWLITERQDLQRLGKPIMTCNKLYDYYKKTVALFRQNTPTINVRSKDFYNINDPKELMDLQYEVSLREGILKNIEYNSKADIAYQMAFENALARGWGAVRVITEYESADSFNQVLKIKAIPISDQAYFDPAAEDSTKSDGEYCGVYTFMDKKMFEKLWPDVPFPISFSTAGTIAGDIPWVHKDKIVVVDHYQKEHFKKTLYLLDNGETVSKKDWDSAIKDYKSALQEFGSTSVQNLDLPKIIDKRESMDYDIWHYQVIGDRILDKALWPGKILPVVFNDCESYYYEGRQRTQSFIRHAIDTQRMLNYAFTMRAQAIRTARKEQYLVTPSMIQNHEYQWQNPEIQQGALVYNVDPITKDKPTMIPPSQVSNALLQDYDSLTSDIQQILGIYAANLGAESNEISGKAINNRAKQGILSAYIPQDNIIRCQEQIARVLLDAIPNVYDTERPMVLIKPDKSQQVVIVNQMTKEGIKNDLKKGNFDVQVKVAPPYEIQKQENLQLIMSLIQNNPQAQQLLGDLIVENINFENRDRIVARFKTLVPKEILAMESGQPPPPPQPPQIDPAVQLKMQELQMKKQQLDNDYDLKNKEYLIKLNELNNQLQAVPAKNYIDATKIQAEIKKAELNYQASLNDIHSKMTQSHLDLLKETAKRNYSRGNMPPESM
jgi:portal protein